MYASCSLTKYSSLLPFTEYFIMRGKRKSHYLQTENSMFFQDEKDVERIGLNSVNQLSIGDFNIDWDNILGRGQFGIVYKGTLNGSNAAFKLLERNGNKRAALLEAQILAQVGFHPNVVNFLGIGNEIENGSDVVCVGIPYIVTEFCSNGSLKTYLKKLRSAGSLQINKIENSSLTLLLNKFCLEIAFGMQHIVHKQIVHRDVATRNILLDKNLVCKIGDFGLSINNGGHNESKNVEGPVFLPWRWMAYESLTEMKFSPMSDMWSYGVVVWEIFTLGETPYAGTNWTPDFVNDIHKGMRLPAPTLSTPSMYRSIQECWNLKCEERPTFNEMSTYFSNLSVHL